MFESYKAGGQEEGLGIVGGSLGEIADGLVNCSPTINVTDRAQILLSVSSAPCKPTLPPPPLHQDLMHCFIHFKWSRAVQSCETSVFYSGAIYYNGGISPKKERKCVLQFLFKSVGSLLIECIA